ncbi:hypothetical protein [Clostridium senegalense]|uniref:hypothetical protein n=1 Tax=Clostridium senegalense TaxID=1465809 RepID=UPI00028864F3|nr:hypothetical protein [Clostridium senegalense]
MLRISEVFKNSNYVEYKQIYKRKKKNKNTKEYKFMDELKNMRRKRKINKVSVLKLKKRSL